MSNSKHLWSDDWGKNHREWLTTAFKVRELTYFPTRGTSARASVLINSDGNVIGDWNQAVSKLNSHRKGTKCHLGNSREIKITRSSERRCEVEKNTRNRCTGSGLGPSPKYLGRSEVTNIVSLLISCLLIAAVAVIRVDKVASISRRLPYWVSHIAGQVRAHVSPGSRTEGLETRRTLSAIRQFMRHQL